MHMYTKRVCETDVLTFRSRRAIESPTQHGPSTSRTSTLAFPALNAAANIYYRTIAANSLLKTIVTIETRKLRHGMSFHDLPPELTARVLDYFAQQELVMDRVESKPRTSRYACINENLFELSESTSLMYPEAASLVRGGKFS